MSEFRFFGDRITKTLAARGAADVAAVKMRGKGPEREASKQDVAWVRPSVQVQVQVPPHTTVFEALGARNYESNNNRMGKLHRLFTDFSTFCKRKTSFGLAIAE